MRFPDSDMITMIAISTIPAQETYRKHRDGRKHAQDVYEISEEKARGGDGGLEEGLVLQKEGHGQCHGGAVEEGQEQQDVQCLEEPLGDV